MIPPRGPLVPKPRPQCPVWSTARAAELVLSLALSVRIWRSEASTSILAALRTVPWPTGLARWWSESVRTPKSRRQAPGSSCSSRSTRRRWITLRSAMGKKPGEGSGRKWARGKGDHVPSIELYLGDRYFTITEQPLAASPPELHQVPTDVLLWLIREGRTGVRGQRRCEARATRNRLVAQCGCLPQGNCSACGRSVLRGDGRSSAFRSGDSGVVPRERRRKRRPGTATHLGQGRPD